LPFNLSSSRVLQRPVGQRLQSSNLVRWPAAMLVNRPPDQIRCGQASNVFPNDGEDTWLRAFDSIRRHQCVIVSAVDESVSAVVDMLKVVATFIAGVGR